MRSWCLFSIFSILFLGRIWGVNENQIEELERRINYLEEREISSHQGQRPFNPCAGPRVKNGKNLHFSGAFIYWIPKMDGLIYANGGVPLENFSDGTKEIELGKSYEVSFGCKPGFKGQIGWNFDHGGWDLLFQYTRLYTRAGHVLNDVNFLPVYDAFFNGLHENYFNWIRASSHLNYQIGDLELGKNYYVSRALKLRPFVGLKGARQRQKHQFDSKGLGDNNEKLFYFTQSGEHLWGVGMRGGLNTSWQFSKHIGLYGNLALSQLWLKYKIGRQDAMQKDDSDRIPVLDVENRLHLMKPAIELACGLRAESYSYSGRYHFLIQAGWEGHTWINQTMQIENRGSYRSSDLSMQGLTANVRFDF